MAGEVTGRVSLSGSVAGITFGGVVSNPSGENPFGFQRTMAIGTNVEIDLAIDVSALGLIWIEADHDCTLKTNSTSAPDDTIALKANLPIKWQTGDPASALFITADVVKFYATFTVATALKIGGFEDITPAV